MRVAIIGGGITGLISAYYLSKHKRLEVELFEKDRELGGLSSVFRIGEAYLEKYYHHIFTTDMDLIKILAELSLSEQLLWRESKVGVFNDNETHPFSTPLDVLSFRVLNLMDRIRFGAGVFLCRFVKNWRRLEGITAKEWAIAIFGKKAYEVIWSPLLVSKFGVESGSISATWLWYRLKKRGESRSKLGTKEQLGYLKGSYKILFERLEREFRSVAVRVHKDTPVISIKADDNNIFTLATKKGTKEFDCILSTVSVPEFLGLVHGLPDDYKQRLLAINYQAALCVALEMRRPLTDYYWLNINSEKIPFVAVIEHTNFIDKSEYGNNYICYLASYLTPDNDLLKKSEYEIFNYYVSYLPMIAKGFSREDVTGFYVFKDMYATPVYIKHYFSKKPAVETPVKGLYMANTSQIYPENRGINYNVRLGRQAAEKILDYLRGKND